MKHFLNSVISVNFSLLCLQSWFPGGLTGIFCVFVHWAFLNGVGPKLPTFLMRCMTQKSAELPMPERLNYIKRVTESDWLWYKGLYR